MYGFRNIEADLHGSTETGHVPHQVLHEPLLCPGTDGTRVAMVAEAGIGPPLETFFGGPLVPGDWLRCVDLPWTVA